MPYKTRADVSSIAWLEEFGREIVLLRGCVCPECVSSHDPKPMRVAASRDRAGTPPISPAGSLGSLLRPPPGSHSVP